jgi:hypothetical protein
MAKILRFVSWEILRDAKMDPILSYMIKHGMPLNRQTWMDLNWGSEVPDPWTAEDEDEVPRIWQHHDED